MTTPCTTIISCYNPTNPCDEADTTTFYNKLSSFVRCKYTLQIIGGDMNARINKDIDNKFCLHNSPNRNGEYQISREQTCKPKPKEGGKIMDFNQPK